MNLDQLNLKNKRTTLSLAVACVVAVTAVSWGLSGSTEARADAAPAAAQGVPVEVAEVVSRKITDWSSFSGRLEAVDRVEIRPQVSGVLTAVHFKDGAVVKKGDLLFTIDQRQYAAEVFGAEARAEYTASELARAERLLAENAIAKRDFEEKKNAAHAAQAALRIAKLNLEFSQIRAPIDGRMSRAEVTVGNLVTANAGAPLTTLVSSDKIYASFDVDEQTFLKYINPARSGKQALPVHLGLANESGYSREGSIHSIDNRLDTGSGTIRVRALFDNKDGQLLPGLYARLRLGGGQEREAILINEKAVGTDQSKRFVLVVDKDNNSAYREVKTGATQDGLVIVESGLQPGERIVVNGLQRVHPGAPVTPQVVDMKTGKAVNPAKPADEKKVG
ncbi:MAG: efflux RND transporter periplasmic adaptor subunit [Rhodocyclaceae bacterium]|jgi:multidrug efflux system membrane fusion protein|nr:efflux RND transporter periplasmic adaptor subunit [Rhodocyclaceae bacterium]